MLITENKLRNIIQKILAEVHIDFKTGQVMQDIESQLNNDEIENDDFIEFEETILNEVKLMNFPVQRITVIDPNVLEEKYDGITDDVHDKLRHIESNVEHIGFDTDYEENFNEDIFEANGIEALDKFLDWAKNDFEYFDERELFKTRDSISFFYTGKSGNEYQVAIMFF